MKRRRIVGRSRSQRPLLEHGSVEARQNALVAWYRRNRRDLPWRRSSDPYAIWLSEVMLQQTTVKVAMPYYREFLRRFPDIGALANAAEDDVLALWSGLGYYHRARNLLRGARHIVAHHGGTFPRTWGAALAVPGVGIYTAAAVLSIAYGEPHAVVDGNVKRVFARLFALRGARWRSEGAFYNLAAEMLRRQAPGEWNQAVMELGATVCTKHRPACPVCPWRGDCVAKARGSQADYPENVAKRAPVAIDVAAAVVRRGQAFLFARRSEGTLMGRLWELPQTSIESLGKVDLVREVGERYGLAVRLGPLIARVLHTITYRRIRIAAYEVSLASALPDDPDRFRFVTPQDLRTIGTSSMSRKILSAIKHPQLTLGLD